MKNIVKVLSKKRISLTMNGKTRVLQKVYETAKTKEWFVYNGQAYV